MSYAELTLEDAFFHRGKKIDGDALFSSCGRYRHWLSRTWDRALPYANFILLNPSKATDKPSENDPTMMRCINFAMDWGYGGQLTTNIFDFISTDPKGMYAVGTEAISYQNDEWIRRIATLAGIVVCGWGTNGDHFGRGTHVTMALRKAGLKLHCLKKTAAGFPNHPLYLKADLRPIAFN